MRVKLIISLLSLMLSSAAHADVKAGVDAWSRGDYGLAVKEWRPLAIAGDADAQFNLGQAYKLGRSVPVDLKQAQDWYRRAAAQGHMQAEDNLGLILFQNGDRQNAMPYIEKSSARGEPRAQYVLATALFNGDLVKKDWVRAYALMTRASASGLPQASSSLAQMDQFIPLEQRQRGLTLARDLETNAMRPNLATTLPMLNRPARATEPTIRSEDIPPSSNVERPISKPPVVVAIARPIQKPVMAKPVVLKPVPTPVIAAQGWRVQLGAFSDQDNARALWGKLKAKISALGGLQPYFVKAGAVMRLQAGPTAGKAAAERVCASVKASGQGCLAVPG